MTHPTDHRRESNRSLPILSALVVVAAWLCPAVVARGQVKHATAIPNSIKTTAANPPTAAEQRAINTFVTETVGYLKQTAVPDQQRAARTDLEGAATAISGTLSGAYTFAYATALNNALLQLESKSQPLSVRLNGAIVATRVAAKVDNAALAPAALAFTGDSAESVSLWGVKAGKFIVPHLLDIGQAGPYDAAIIRSVLTFRHNGAIVEEAYDDFTGDQIIVGAPPGAGPGPAVPPPPARSTAAITPLVALMEARAGLYEAAAAQVAAGADPDLPAAPQADNRGYSFLALPTLWRSATPAQQKALARAGLDLITQAIGLVGAVLDRTPTDPPDAVRKTDLVAMINQAGSAFSVIGGFAGNQAVSEAAGMLTTAKAGAGLPQATFVTRLAALDAALNAAGLVAPAAPLPKPSTAAPPPAAAPAPARVTPPTSRPATPPRTSTTPTRLAAPATRARP